MIKYEAICKKGLVRSNNEDNFYLNGKYLPMIHCDTAKYSGYVKNGVFAVFDGMGGEEQGEAASFLAAETLSHHADYSIIDLCSAMNEEVCRFSREKKLSFCGSTLVMVSFKEDSASCVNLGDSRLYFLHDGQLKQISQDHTITILGRKKLTQCLGIPESQFIICPHMEKISMEDGDKFLLCSDGITDMISDEELEKILKDEDALEQIEGLVIDRGAVDNYTGVILEKSGFNKQKRL